MRFRDFWNLRFKCCWEPYDVFDLGYIEDWKITAYKEERYCTCTRTPGLIFKFDEKTGWGTDSRYEVPMFIFFLGFYKGLKICH